MNNTNSKSSKQTKKILVVRRNGLGDAIYTALALRTLSKNYPKIKFSILCSTYTEEIYKLISPKITRYTLSSEKFLGTYFGLFFHPLFRRIRKQKFDLVFNSSTTYSSRAIYMMKCCGAKEISSVPSPKKTFWNNFIDKKLKAPNNGKLHQVEKISLIFKQINLQISVPKKFESKKIKQPKILLCPHSSSKRNQWNIENWHSLYKALIKKEKNVDICLPKSSPFNQIFGVKVKSPQNTKSLINLIKKYNLIVSQEGGTGHIAAILNKSIITISNENLKTRWAPWQRNSIFIHTNDNQTILEVEKVFKEIKNFIIPNKQ